MTDPFPQPSGRFRWVQAAGVRPFAAAALVCEPLLDWADHLFTTREWALGRRAPGTDDSAWGEIAEGAGVARSHLRRLHQVHGAAVAVARVDGDGLPDADIIVSTQRELALAVQTADCVPLLVADRRTGAVAAAHAGWRGLASTVPMLTIRALERECGSRPQDLVAAIGPAIGPCCYEVGSDVRQAFASSFAPEEAERWFRRAGHPDKWMFDTWASTRSQLEAAGVPVVQIFESRLCTASHPAVFCSYRRDGSPAGRMAAAIKPRDV